MIQINSQNLETQSLFLLLFIYDKILISLLPLYLIISKKNTVFFIFLCIILDTWYVLAIIFGIF